MAKNNNLTQAKKAKNDEFYTLISDVEKELKHYKSQFEGKVVYCNCDDPEESNFWKFFELNFEEYKLKKLISTHYDAEKPTYKLELSADIDGDGKITKGDIVKTPLKQNGDFRSEESINLLKESDIVVTNPPFSLFREYVAQLMKYKKKFLIIGNQNAITYKEIFPLIRDEKIWLGNRKMSPWEFRLPKTATEYKRSDDNEEKYATLGSVCWFTNLSVKRFDEKITLVKTYNPKDYPKYDNYDAIEVGKVANIPKDYTGVMGVPITFLYSYNPKQFEILDINPHFYSIISQGLKKPKQLSVNGKDTFARILIKKKNENNTNENIG